MRALLLRAVATVALVAGALVLPATASASPPANDDFANATAITSLPFSDSADNTSATTEPGEDLGCGIEHTVWYSLTPSQSKAVTVDMNGSSFSDTEIAVYRDTGSGLAGLQLVNCQNFSPFTFTAQAGTTYYLQLGDRFGGGGALHVNVNLIPPPPNDAFANAAPVSGLPFTDTPDLTGATLEPGEPNPSCSFEPSPESSVWYAFTPTETGSYTMNTSTASFFPQLAAYTGGSLGTLSQVACGDQATFHAVAGTTYYIQLLNEVGPGGTIYFYLSPAPALVMGFVLNPPDPSSLDTVQFFDTSFDPGGVGINAMRWDFGDGATATGCCPSHRYTADGNYTVSLTDSTSDGRTGSISQVVNVKTHDVAISRVLVPQSARVGQTRTITVGLTNSRYPETVQVQLLKSVAGGGWQQVGVLTQYVPIRGGNRTTNFDFNYTFTPDDAALGKVSFQAVATIQGARDAIPTDNTFISLPTKVIR